MIRSFVCFVVAAALGCSSPEVPPAPDACAPECQADGDCPASPEPCEKNVCSAGACAAVPVPPGEQGGCPDGQICRGDQTCAPPNDPHSCSADAECAIMQQCQIGTCVAGWCVVSNVPIGDQGACPAGEHCEADLHCHPDQDGEP